MAGLSSLWCRELSTDGVRVVNSIEDSRGLSCAVELVASMAGGATCGLRPGLCVDFQD